MMKMISIAMMMLVLSGCTLGEALLGAGAAGLGGYIIGHEQHEHSDHRY